MTITTGQHDAILASVSTKIIYIAEQLSDRKWLPVCHRNTPRTARLWAAKKHPAARIRIIKATFQVVKPFEVR